MAGTTPLDHIDDFINIQSRHGNWDWDPYMFGLLNGLILAKSTITNEDPVFNDTPEKWVSADRPSALELARAKHPGLQRAYEDYKMLEKLILGDLSE